MPIVTVSREYGSGGQSFGRAVAERIKADFLDAKLVLEVSNRLRCAQEVVEQWDERGEGLIVRLLRAMQSAHPETVAPAPVSSDAFSSAPSPDRVAATVREVILEEARSENAVFVGRGAVFVLKDHPHALHVRLIADFDARAACIADRFGLSPEESKARVEAADRDRSRYIRHHFGTDWNDPKHYDVVFNTSRTPMNQIVDSSLLLLPQKGDES